MNPSMSLSEKTVSMSSAIGFSSIDICGGYPAITPARCGGVLGRVMCDHRHTVLRHNPRDERRVGDAISEHGDAIRSMPSALSETVLQWVASASISVFP